MAASRQNIPFSFLFNELHKTSDRNVLVDLEHMQCGFQNSERATKKSKQETASPVM